MKLLKCIWEVDIVRGHVHVHASHSHLHVTNISVLPTSLHSQSHSFLSLPLPCHPSPLTLLPSHVTYSLLPTYVLPTSPHPSPTPVSVICSIPFSLSALILMDISSVALRADFSVRERNRILSNASEALDINSRRKICEEKSHENHLTSNQLHTE